MDIRIHVPIGRRKLLIILGLVSTVLVLALLLWPRKTQSQTEYEFFVQQVSYIKDYTSVVKDDNKLEPSQALLLNNIEEYQNALLEGLAACEQIDSRISLIDKAIMKPYENAVTQTELFCRDYEDVVDYSRKVSKATRQFIAYSTDNFSSSNTGLTDLNEILGYTITDLNKLKNYPLQDPGLEEMIAGINNLKKQTETSIASKSSDEIKKLIENAETQKKDLITARNYFWNNTIGINSMDRSIDRLLKLFKEEEPKES